MLTWTDDKLLKGEIKRDELRRSSVSPNGIFLGQRNRLSAHYAAGICDGAVAQPEWIHYMFLSAEIGGAGPSPNTTDDGATEGR